MSIFFRHCPIDSHTCSDRKCLGEPRDPDVCPKAAPSTATTIDVSKGTVPDYFGQDVGDICLKDKIGGPSGPPGPRGATGPAGYSHRGLLYHFNDDGAWFTLHSAPDFIDP